MTWTNIGPRDTAAEALINLMIDLESQREFYASTGAPKEAANKGHVIDELFDTWLYLCNKEPLQVDGPPQNKFAAWRDGQLSVAFTAAPFVAA